MRKDSLFYIPLIIFPLGTLITSVPIIGMSINKILMIFIILGLGIFLTKMRKKVVIYVASVTALMLIDLVITDFPLYNANEVLYLFIWVVFLNCYVEHWQDWYLNLYRFRRLIIFEAILWNALTFVAFFISSCYDDSGAFLSWTGGMHRLDSSALLTVSLILYIYVIEKDKRILLYIIVPFVAVLLSGSRTYILVFLAIGVMIFYQIIEKKWKFWLTIVPLIVSCMAFILSTEVMQNRMNFSDYVLDKYGYLGAMTSGRSIFWEIDMREFFRTPILNQIIGNGFNFIRKTNEIYYGNPIWAHNDFINILGCNGYIGLILYWGSYWRSISVYKELGCTKKGKVLKLLLIHFTCLFNAVFNMLYTYQNSAFAIPFLLFFLWGNNLRIGSNKEKEELVY